MTLIAIYTNLPPARATEVRTLRFHIEGSDGQHPFSLKNFPGENVLVKSRDGTLCFHYQKYKTAKFRGHDAVPVEVQYC